MDLTVPNFYIGFAVAFALGALVGLEREHHRDKVVIAGVRTFPLFAVAGYLLSVLSLAVESPWILAAGVVSMGAVAVTFMVVRHQLGSTGLTTPAAMIVIFVVGAIVALGFVQEAVVVGVGVTFILLTKERLHRFAHVLGDEEFLSTLQFIAILFILFPFALAFKSVPWLPFVGAGDLIDPTKLLLLVLFVSGISFTSFLVMRQVGPRRGIEFSGFLGGLVSSEATAVSLSTHAQQNRALLKPAVAGVLFAVATMVLRNLAIAAFADPTFSTLWFMLAPCAAMGAVAAAFAIHERRGGRVHVHERLHVKNPFAVGPALRFVAVFAVLSVGATLAQRYFGDWGVYAIALGGFAAAGAAVASAAALFAAGKTTLAIAGTTAVLATVAGALNKLVVLRTAGVTAGTEVAGRVRRPIVVVAVVGVLVMLLIVVASMIGAA